MTFNSDTWWNQRQAEARQQRKQDFNATCPNCQADILDQLEYAAYENSLDSTVMIGCPNCELELTFELQWTIAIHKATIQKTKLYPPAQSVESVSKSVSQNPRFSAFPPHNGDL